MKLFRKTGMMRSTDGVFALTDEINETIFQRKYGILAVLLVMLVMAAVGLQATATTRTPDGSVAEAEIAILRAYLVSTRPTQIFSPDLPPMLLTQSAGIEVSKEPLIIGPGENLIEYNVPLTSGPNPVVGNSIENLAKDVPLFSPIEGLDDAIWKGKKCTNCHMWDKKTLCDQGKVYVENEPAHILRKQHPYGGAFKLALRNWSKTGCK